MRAALRWVSLCWHTLTWQRGQWRGLRWGRRGGALLGLSRLWLLPVRRALLLLLLVLLLLVVLVLVVVPYLPPSPHSLPHRDREYRACLACSMRRSTLAPLSLPMPTPLPLLPCATV